MGQLVGHAGDALSGQGWADGAGEEETATFRFRPSIPYLSDRRNNRCAAPWGPYPSHGKGQHRQRGWVPAHDAGTPHCRRANAQWQLWGFPVCTSAVGEARRGPCTSSEPGRRGRAVLGQPPRGGGDASRGPCTCLRGEAGEVLT